MNSMLCVIANKKGKKDTDTYLSANVSSIHGKTYLSIWDSLKEKEMNTCQRNNLL